MHSGMGMGKDPTAARTRHRGGSHPVMVAAAVAVITLAGCGNCGSSATAARRAEVEARGATIMPFDLQRTTHVFRSDATGGVQLVVAKDPHDEVQIALVRAHLRREARRFASGNFTDPMAIHGMTMPGIARLRLGFDRIDVTFATLRRGARIRYATTEAALVTALHDWFDAQLTDHGAHARG
ncbi:MAG: aspartate carbamoyltransferase [Acidimicrobiia bacterium]